MDKYEYSVCSEEIKSLIQEKDFKAAAEIADTIDWRKVRNVRMLCMVSDVYKMVRRYEDSRAILMLAYDRRPGSRMIVYALVELCIKLDDVFHAWEYYKEYCRIAGDDSGRFVLQYKIYAAQDVSLEEQIKVLEDLKSKDYTDRWAYELAYLYHRVGLGTKCVEECDELIVWFGEGRYVRKAMELKMLHEPLTAKQQAVYDSQMAKEIESGDTRVIPNLDMAMTKETEGQSVDESPTMAFKPEEVEEIQVKTMEDSPYNTINLQKALAASMAEILDNSDDEYEEEIWEAEPVEREETVEEIEALEEEEPEEVSEDLEEEEVFVAASEEVPENDEKETEVFFEDPNTKELTSTIEEIQKREVKQEETEEKEIPQGVRKVIVPDTGMSSADFATQESDFDEILTQDGDGQIRLVLPEAEQLEKQITGQISIEDVLLEWEERKKETEKQLKGKIEKKVKQNTGEMFAEYDKASKNGLLEQLEEAAVKAQEEEARKAEALENEALEREKESEEKRKAETQATVQDRPLTQEEKELFESFIQSKKAKAQLLMTLDTMSLAAYTGNVIITGDESVGGLNLAKSLVRHLKQSDGNFSGKAAKISGGKLNTKNPKEIIDGLANGALIIESAGGMNCSTAEALAKALQSETNGVVVFLVDSKSGINSLLKVNEILLDGFNARIDIEALNDDSLVEYGKRFAYEKEYSIDDMGALALHTRIAKMQTISHAVTTGEVRQIVKTAISHANRKTPGHFCDILLGRRYDEEDMIVLGEKDFLFGCR